MLTETTIRDNPLLVKALTGIPADSFWTMMEQLEQRYPTYERQRHARAERQRAVGGGRPCDLPLVIRVVMLLTYVRTHISQTLAALLFGGTQPDVSRDLRRLLPLLQEVLPVPMIWVVTEEGDRIPDDVQVSWDDLADTRVLVDATEQEVARPGDSEQCKRYYSGKQKEFTIKTQIVTDDEHHIVAISEAVPGTRHDKKLCDALHTLDRLPDGCEVDMDKGYQGVAHQVDMVTVRDTTTGEAQQVPRLVVKTPIKKPREGTLTEEQRAYNQTINTIRVRVEHCIGWAKNWAILATQFRCAHTIYTSVMQVVCGLVNQQTARWQAARKDRDANCA